MSPTFRSATAWFCTDMPWERSPTNAGNSTTGVLGICSQTIQFHRAGTVCRGSGNASFFSLKASDLQKIRGDTGGGTSSTQMVTHALLTSADLCLASNGLAATLALSLQADLLS